MDLIEIIRKHALKNAYDFGRANSGSIAGKVIAEYPDAKLNMKDVMKQISQEIARISKLSKEKIEEEMSDFEYLEKKQEDKEFEISGARIGKVVVRYPPEPNGWSHIGHAKAFCLSWKIAKKYSGKIILRWDDTNPEAEKGEFVSAIKKGIEWLGLDWNEEIYCSDYLPKMYALCEKLISDGNAYSCFCQKEQIAEGRERKKRCRCFEKNTSFHLETWKKMLEGPIKEGEAVIRLTGDMESLNTVMRDPTLFRIIETPHYRQKNKYRVWPTYDFQGAVMDSVLGITHPIRSKEYELRDEAYIFLLKKLNLDIPELISISRLSIKNAPISKRLLRPLVESGKLMGWNDPRLLTLAGLEKRGILPKAVREFVLSFGISKVESEPDLELLLNANRKLIDPVSKHFFFVLDPVELEIKNNNKNKVILPLYPKEPEKGTRNISIGGAVHISKNDALKLKEGEILRLKDFCTIQINKIGNKIIATLIEEQKVPKIIQWVSENKLNAKILVPKEIFSNNGEFNPHSLELIKGYCELDCMKLKEGEIIQFERFGFVRLDKKENDELIFIYSC
ncbi:MAG: glutamate--tRNA ligase [Candidatus Micrarchaeia archaeon]